MFNPILLLGKLPKAFEGRLFVGLISGTSIVLGLVALFSGLAAPSDKQALAQEAVLYGSCAIALGLGIVAVVLLVERCRNYD